MSVVRVHAVMVAYHGGEQLVAAMDALLAACYHPLDVTIVDNGGSDRAALERLQASGHRVSLVAPGVNLGFAAGVNAAIADIERREAVAAGDVYVLVNQDCIVDPGAIGPLVVALMADAEVAVVGARLLSADRRRLVHAGGIVHANGLTDHLGRGLDADDSEHLGPAEVEYVTGALCAFRAATWHMLGPFAESYRPVYFEEVDFCLRARRAGWRVRYEPASTAVHEEAGASSGSSSALYLRRYHASRMRFLARHLLSRGQRLSVVGAELSWLWRVRSFAQVWPALRAYPIVMRELLVQRRAAGSSVR